MLLEVSRTNKRENPVFKLFAKISSLENFRLYGIPVYSLHEKKGIQTIVHV